MTKTKEKPLADIVDNLKVPQDLDHLVTKTARLEYRTKAAIISLALVSYIERNHPGLINSQSASSKQTAKEATALSTNKGVTV